MNQPSHRLALAALAVVAVACSSASPSASPTSLAGHTSAPTATPTPSVSPSPQPTPASTPQPTASPVTYRSSEHVTLHPAGTVPRAPLGYVEYEPPNAFDADAPAPPLLVFLHGSGESGDGDASSLTALFATGLPRVLSTDNWPEDRPFVVLAPQFGPTQEMCTDPGLIDMFLRFAVRHYPVDRTRVYLTGLSCGAFGAWDYLGMHTNERVAAAVLFSGDGHYAFELAGCDLGRVPIWAIHGGADLNVDPNGSIDPITDLNACTDPPPVDARLNVYPGVGHAVWQPFYDGSKRDVDIYAWMLGYTNPQE
jgi:poly(3-hydroxybutyrate) depolymerase